MTAAEQAQPVKANKAKKIVLFIVILLIIGAMTAANMYRVSLKDVVRVTTAQVEQEIMVEKVPGEGIVSAVDKEILLSDIGGVIKEIKVQMGDQVQAGQVLLTVTVPKAQEKLSQAQAAVSSAQANLTKAQSGVELNTAAAALSSAKSAFTAADDHFKRTQILVDNDAIPSLELEQAQIELDKQRIALDKALFDYESLQATEQMSIQALTDSLKLAEQQLQTVQREAAGIGLTSPRSGQVLSVQTQVGDLISEFAPVMTMADLQQLEIKGEVVESEAGKIKVGQKVQIMGIAFEGQEYLGQITQVGGELVNKTQLQSGEDYYLPVVISMDEHEGLLPGFSVDMDITIAEENALVVPGEALVEQDGETGVWRVADNIASLINVQTGISDGLLIQIREGLEAGDVIVLNPPPELKEGSRVRVR